MRRNAYFTEPLHVDQVTVKQLTLNMLMCHAIMIKCILYVDLLYRVYWYFQELYSLYQSFYCVEGKFFTTCDQMCKLTSTGNLIKTKSSTSCNQHSDCNIRTFNLIKWWKKLYINQLTWIEHIHSSRLKAWVAKMFQPSLTPPALSSQAYQNPKKSSRRKTCTR